MKKKKYLTVILIIILISLSGCKNKFPELDQKSIAFQTSSYIDKNDDDASYLTIEYNGRVYLPYGTLKSKINDKDIRDCIGYIVQDETNSSMPDKDNKDTRIYTLTSDPNNNFLMEYYIGTTLMNTPVFLRAVDTQNKEINIPNFIDDLGYGYWKGEVK